MSEPYYASWEVKEMITDLFEQGYKDVSVFYWGSKKDGVEIYIACNNSPDEYHKPPKIGVDAVASWCIDPHKGPKFVKKYDYWWLFD